MLYHFAKENHEPAVFAHCLEVATKNKEWAENKNKELNGKEWESASIISQNMLKEYLSTDTETLAIKHYKYLRLRSHSYGNTTHFPIDKPAFELWTKLTGKQPKND